MINPHAQSCQENRADENNLKFEISSYRNSSLLLHRQPFLYIAAALVVGILAERQSEPAPWSVQATAVLAATLSFVFILTRRHSATAIALMAGFVAAGAWLSLAERNSVESIRLKQLFDAGVITAADPVELTGRLTALPEPAPQSSYLDVEAETIRVRGQTLRASGSARLMLLLTDDETQSEFNRLGLGYGSRVRILVRLCHARSFKNPGSPDFNEFLERSGYDLKGTIKSPLLIELVGQAPTSPVLAALFGARRRLMEAIDSHFNEPVTGTIKAMLVGNRYFLDPEAVERMRESSTFHVLSISGMHVGIIAWVLLGGTVRRKRPRTVRVLFCLLLLWAYAFMVSLQPPVTRAALMISVGLVGPMLFRRAASINTVSLAAFLMLALKPSLVADPGFQLSFIAVAAIVAIAMPIAEKLRRTGQWQPHPQTPHPPQCSRAVRLLGETLYWDEAAFLREIRSSPISYRLEKARAARVLGRLRLQWLARSVTLLVITSAAIQLATLPLMVFYFNRVTPAGVLTNIVSGLLTAVLMLGAIATIAIGALSAWLGGLIKTLVVASHYLLVNSVAPFSAVPVASFRAAHYEGWPSVIYALYFIPLAALVVLIDRWQPTETGVRGQGSGVSGDKKLSGVAQPLTLTPGPRPPTPGPFLCGVAMIVLLVLVVRPVGSSPNGKLTVHFLDVGQGDAMLVVFPQGATMLIDAGGDLKLGGRTGKQNDDMMAGGEGDEEKEANFTDSSFSIGEAVVSRFLWSRRLTGLDYALVTHAHADHIGGLSDVIKNFRVSETLVGRVPSDNQEFARFARSVTSRGLLAAQIGAGDRFQIQGVTVEVLWPPRAVEIPVTSGNDDSVVLRLTYGEVSMLLAGDIEQKAEEGLLKSGVDLRADVLKVPHHGSATSSTESFIDRVRPWCVVVSVGEHSRHSHPHKIVVDRYRSRGVRLFQTGRDGTVTAETDGLALNVSTYK
jgi:competence protein ComEC